MEPASGSRTAPLGIASPGHLALAATMIALGIVGLVEGNFTPTWSGVPRDFPARQLLAYLCALVSLGSGLGLLWRRAAVAASTVLLFFFLLWLLLFRLPYFITAPSGLNTWWSTGDTAVMMAGVWVLHVWFVGDQPRQPVGWLGSPKGLRIARVLFGLGLIPFGVAHFINLQGTASLVPSWLPWHLAWAYFTGGAFVAAGLAVLTGLGARLAATATVVQLGAFTLLVWGPVVLSGPTPFQWSEFLDSWALTAGAWAVADSYRGMPWIGGPNR